MEQNKKPLNKKLIAGVVALAAVIAILLGVYFANRQPTVSGSKTITVSVFDDESSTVSTITTTAEYLRGALDQEDSGIVIEGTESDYGLFVTTVNGVTADDSQQQWWCFTKGGEMLNTGVDTTPIADGDAFEITLTEGY